MPKGLTMMAIDRRHLLRSGALGLGLAGLPAWAVGLDAGFTHGIASGEPGQRQVLLWTRYVGQSGDAPLRAEIAATPDFTRIAAGGDTIASPDHDWCAKLVLNGLEPGRWYYYRFVAADGTRSEIGRTRTLAEGAVRRFTLGVFSCSNIGYGWFNAYGHAARRDDIDLMLHLGDYTYEYRQGRSPSPEQTAPGRTVEPVGETVHLEDYRTRYALYRRDPDLRALHARFPVVQMWDDHESANDSWVGGAENHDPATEGDWGVRKAAAVRAYREWMPVSDDDWAEYRIGDLAALFRPEERLTARTRQANMAAALSEPGDPTAALIRFRDTTWSDPAHTLMGADQERWFAERLRAAAGETRWQVFAQQVVVGITLMPAEALRWVPAGADPRAVAFLRNKIAAAKIGLPSNMDNWDGYPAARSRMLRNGLDADANLIVLSGDSHNAWAFDLAEQGTPAGVEFGGQSVTSPGLEAGFKTADPRAVAAGFVGSSPELRWADTSGRGYMTVTITPERATSEWLFLDTIRTRSLAIARTHRARVDRGARRLSA